MQTTIDENKNAVEAARESILGAVETHTVWQWMKTSGLPAYEDAIRADERAKVHAALKAAGNK